MVAEVPIEEVSKLPRLLFHSSSLDELTQSSVYTLWEGLREFAILSRKNKVQQVKHCLENRRVLKEWMGTIKESKWGRGLI